MKKFLAFINGNKTLICMTILYALTLESVKNVIPADIISITEYAFGILGFAAAGHKVQKQIAK